MTQFLLIGDLHFSNRSPYGKLNPNTGLNTHVEEQFELLDSILEENAGVNYIVFGGDVFDYYLPGNTLRTRLASSLQRAIDRGSHIIIMTGNHDQGKFQSPYADLQLLVPNIRVLSSPAMLTKYRIAFVPWIRDHMKVTTVLQQHKEKGAEILVGHFAVHGSLAHGGHHFKAKTGHQGVSAESLSGFKYVCLSHFHQPSEFYIGALWKNNFGEEEQGNNRYARLTFDTPDSEGALEYITVPDLHKFQTIVIKEDEEEDVLSRVKQDSFEGSIVRLRPTGKKSWLANSSTLKFIEGHVRSTAYHVVIDPITEGEESVQRKEAKALMEETSSFDEAVVVKAERFFKDDPNSEAILLYGKMLLGDTYGS